MRNTDLERKRQKTKLLTPEDEKIKERIATKPRTILSEKQLYEKKLRLKIGL